MHHHNTTVTTDVKVERFTEAWPHIADALGHAFRMSAEQRAWLYNKPVARLIASIPFVAGCRKPERTAVAHVGTYLLSIRETKPFFNALPDDDEDVYARLRPIMDFEGGDEALIASGMAYLALNMIEDYRDDVQLDVALGKHNPVGTGDFDYEGLHAELSSRIQSDHTAAYAKAIGQGPGTLGVWG